jgi:hypothetical protein
MADTTTATPTCRQGSLCGLPGRGVLPGLARFVRLAYPVIAGLASRSSARYTACRQTSLTATVALRGSGVPALLAWLLRPFRFRYSWEGLAGCSFSEDHLTPSSWRTLPQTGTFLRNFG